MTGNSEKVYRIYFDFGYFLFFTLLEIFNKSCY